MNLFVMMDEMLRNRHTLYDRARDGQGLRSLCLHLLTLFLLTTAIYGAVMGSYRCLHPDFTFSNFELGNGVMSPIRGEVAGMTAERNAVYTTLPLDGIAPDATIRFNVSDPSDPYTIAGISKEKGFTKITLADGAVLREPNRWLLPALVAGKIPLMFLLTLLVCSLALYIINLAYGLKLHFLSTMTLMLFALAGTGVMLMVFAPISLLFSVVTGSYHFMKILHVLVFTIAGLFGVRILGEGLLSTQLEGDNPLLLNEARKRVRPVLLSWLTLYCLVGMQLAWTLKPFLGTPYLPATPPFRLEQGNIFVSTLQSMRGMSQSQAAEDTVPEDNYIEPRNPTR